jgi:hypothetical protein
MMMEGGRLLLFPPLFLFFFIFPIISFFSFFLFFLVLSSGSLSLNWSQHCCCGWKKLVLGWDDEDSIVAVTWK